MQQNRNRVTIGHHAEDLALIFLEKAGLKLLTRRWRAQSGEIDLIMKEDEALVFIEVRSRRNFRYGYPEESLTPKKRQRLYQTALAYLYQNESEEVNWRIDLVTVHFGKQPTIYHYPATFDLSRC